MGPYKREDFANAMDIRWCPGCGDYAILNALQRVLPEFNLPPEKHVFISGIGCAGRFPYYMNAPGFHTIHGRALAVATGLKTMREDLTVWVITGDGDALSIGGNHFIHALRRNVNLKVLLFNNQVYGLTKGQFSPTSQAGQVTKTSPEGLVQNPLNPLVLALSAGATFVARGLDKDPPLLMELFRAAYAHQGLAFIEIYQDCHIFNAGAFDQFSLKTNRLANTLPLTANQALLFGAHAEEAIVREGSVWRRGAKGDKATVRHDPSNWMQAMQLAKLTFPDFPVPVGVYYQVQQPVFSTPRQLAGSEQALADFYRAKACWQFGK